MTTMLPLLLIIDRQGRDAFPFAHCMLHGCSLIEHLQNSYKASVCWHITAYVTGNAAVCS